MTSTLTSSIIHNLMEMSSVRLLMGCIFRSIYALLELVAMSKTLMIATGTLPANFYSKVTDTYHKLRNIFVGFYECNGDFVGEYNTTLTILLQQVITHPKFSGVYKVYKLRKILGSDNFSVRFIKCISAFVRKGYLHNILYYTACLVVYRFTVNHVAFLSSGTMINKPHVTP